MQEFHNTAHKKLIPEVGDSSLSLRARCLDFISRQWSLQYPQLFLWVPVWVGVGIAVYFGLPFEPSPVLTGLFFAVPLLLLGLSHGMPAVRIFAFMLLLMQNVSGPIY